jgi:hypothetical protein
MISTVVNEDTKLIWGNVGREMVESSENDNETRR